MSVEFFGGKGNKKLGSEKLTPLFDVSFTSTALG